MNRSKPVFILALGAACALAAAAAHAQCPTNTINVCGLVSSTEPRREADGCGPAAMAFGSYDLTLGALTAQIDADYPDGTGSTQVRTDDVYRVVGPPSLVPLPFNAEFRVHGRALSYYCTNSSGSAAIEEGALKDQTSYSGMRCEYGGVDQTLSIAIEHGVGEEFHIVLSASAMASPGASAVTQGTLGFSGLPDGYVVVSCQGFTSEPPVPVRALSWGRVKSLYR